MKWQILLIFKKYVCARDEEKRRIKQVSILSTKNKSIEDLLHNISDCVECSIVTKHFSEISQIVGKENILDSATLGVIINSLKDYSYKILERINELNTNVDMKNTVISEM